MLARTVVRVHATGAASRTHVRNRRRAAARRVREIAGKLRTRGKLARGESTAAIRRVTGELVGLAETAAAEAQAVLRNGRRRLRQIDNGRLRGQSRSALDELATTIERTGTIATQTRARLSGQTPQGATRLVSLHDPDARPIRKGCIDRPVEFGYKAQVVDNDDGVVVDYSVEPGAAPDAPQLAPAVERIKHRTGCAPRAVTADRGYGEAASRKTCMNWVCTPWRSHARPRRRRRAARSSTDEPSADWSSGEQGPRAESATSSAATDGTEQGSMHAAARRSGADTVSSPTT
jgi:transposase, IS5 family